MSQSSHTVPRPSGVVSILWALLTIALFVVLAAVSIDKTGIKDVVSEERAQKRIDLRAKVDGDDAQRLNTLAWVDKSKGIVQLPLSRAKEVAIEELKARKQAASTVALDPVLPLPPPFDPKASEPQPPALPSSPQGADTIRFSAVTVDSAASPVPAQQSATPSPASVPDPSLNKGADALNAK